MVTHYGCAGGVVVTDGAARVTEETGGCGLLWLGGGVGLPEEGGVVTFIGDGLVGLGGVGLDF